MFAADKGVKQLEATSKHRARPCLEWSKQLSREAVPFFATSPTPNIRQSSGSEGPLRHRAEIILDKVPGRELSPTFGGGKNLNEDGQDPRDYDPYKKDEDVHSRPCPVNWKRAPARVTMSGAGGAGLNAESMIDPFVYPGWASKGKGGVLSKSERDTFMTKHLEENKRKGPLTESELNSSAVTNDVVMPRTIGGVMSKARREAATPIMNESSLLAAGAAGGGGANNNKNNGEGQNRSAASASNAANNTSHHRTASPALFPDGGAADSSGVDRGLLFLSRNRGGVALAKLASRDRPKKLSQTYAELLRDAAAPPAAGPKMRITQGFAPMRANHRLTLNDLLGQTAKDVTRAKSVMDRCFGDRGRTELRTLALYTPPPS